MDAKSTILTAEKLGEAGVKVLKEFPNVDCSYNFSPEELRTKISLYDALIVRRSTKVTRVALESAVGRLKVVGRASVGIDNVDLQAATEHGCLVVNAATANIVAAVEHGIALLTTMARNVTKADASVKAGFTDSRLLSGLAHHKTYSPLALIYVSASLYLCIKLPGREGICGQLPVIDFSTTHAILPAKKMLSNVSMHDCCGCSYDALQRQFVPGQVATPSSSSMLWCPLRMGTCHGVTYYPFLWNYTN